MKFGLLHDSWGIIVALLCGAAACVSEPAHHVRPATTPSAPSNAPEWPRQAITQSHFAAHRVYLRRVVDLFSDRPDLNHLTLIINQEGWVTTRTAPPDLRATKKRDPELYALLRQAKAPIVYRARSRAIIFAGTAIQEEQDPVDYIVNLIWYPPNADRDPVCGAYRGSELTTAGQCIIPLSKSWAIQYSWVPDVDPSTIDDGI